MARILLGRLLQERLALGQAVEFFAKHYQREALRSLLKLQDLVDLVEPPWGGSSSATAMRQPLGEVMELDEGKLDKEEATSGGQHSPGEANLGLG